MPRVVNSTLPQMLPKGALGWQVMGVERAYTAALAAALGADRGGRRASGLTVPRFLALQALAAHPGASGTQLAGVLQVTDQSMTTILVALERAGLITRVSPVGNGRRRSNTLTPAGAEALKKSLRKVRALDMRLAKSLGVQQQDVDVLHAGLGALHLALAAEH